MSQTTRNLSCPMNSLLYYMSQQMAPQISSYLEKKSISYREEYPDFHIQSVKKIKSILF